MRIEQLTVLGAGVIGGSICLAARRAGIADHIVAIDRTPASDRADVADHWLDAADERGIEEALARSTLTVLCTPVSAIVRALPTVLQRTTGLVTDCGSTKVKVSAAAAQHPRRASFVPGHPMAGHPEGGLGHASPSLFEGRSWILCPKDSSEDARASMEEFVRQCGAKPVLLDAGEHDRSVAYTSHLPQVVASALSVLVADQKASATAGPGFASATRVAGGAEAMWKDIFETNGAEIARALRSLAERLDGLGTELSSGDAQGLLDTLERARRLRS